MISRKGEMGDQVLVVFFFFMLFIIVGGIALSMSIFYSGELDYRSSDAALLYTSLARCLSAQEVNSAFFTDLYKNCGLAENVFQTQKLVISVFDDKTIYFTQGDTVQCKSQNLNQKFARCVSGDVNAIFDKKQVTLHIITGSNQQLNLGTAA